MKQLKGLKRISVLLLVLIFALSLVPSTALASQTDEVDIEWYNFRNNPENNGVTDRKTPVNPAETGIRWSAQYGTGWSSAPTPPLILDDALYVGTAKKVLKLDKETGELLAESEEMVSNVGYAMNPITYADGKLFVQVGNGVIQALDFKTLEVLWSSKKLTGQTLCPIAYTKIDGKGYIYTGTWTNELRDGYYICLSTDDEGIYVDKNSDGSEKTFIGKDGETKTRMVKDPKWIFSPSGADVKKYPDLVYDKVLNDNLLDEDADKVDLHPKRGFYWSGAYATENYIAVGSDDGTKEGDYTANGVFYTLDPLTGEVIDRLDGVKGDIRSSTVFYEGSLYFATKGGLMYKIPVGNDGKLGKATFIDLGGMATASPLVYKNKIYLGICGEGGQFDADGGHHFAVISNEGELSQDSLLYTLPIKGYPQAAALLSTAYEHIDYDGDGKADGRVYIYFTYNAPPGGIYYTYDTPNQTEAAKESTELFVPVKELQQYCISTISCDREGRLYYKNDSCNIFAVETNLASIKDMKVTLEDESEVTFNENFNSKIREYDAKIPSHTKSVNFELTLPEGNSAKINGVDYTGGVQAVPILNEGENIITVTAITGEYEKSYQIKLTCSGANASLEDIIVNTSNAFSLNRVGLARPMVDEIAEYQTNLITTEKTFYNVWPVAKDKSATVKVYAEENVNPDKIQSDGSIRFIRDYGTGNYRYPVYLDDTLKDARVRIEVTSENKETTKTYHLDLIREIKVASISFDNTELQLNAQETHTLAALFFPENATNQLIHWTTTDEGVATVDENGLVTAISDGIAQITATTDDGGYTAVCEVMVGSNLEIIKANKLTEIDNAYKSYIEEDYRTNEWAELLAIFDNAKATVNSATEITAVSAVNVEALKLQADEIKTDAELTEAESSQALADAKADKLAQIDEAFGEYKEEDYRTDEWSELKAIFDNAKATVNSATEITDINAVNVEALKSTADEIKTDAELTKEETPKVPTITKAYAVATELNIEWDEEENATGYRVAIYNYTYKKYYYYETTDAFFKLNTAVGGRKYLVKVTSLYAKDGKEVRTDYSKGDYITTTLAVPTVSYAGLGDNATEIRIKWNAVKGATSYRIAIFNYTYNRWFYYNTKYTSKDLGTSIGGRNYLIKVRAINGKNDSAYTSDEDAKVVTTLATPTLTSLTLDSKDTTDFTATWDKVECATSYRVAVYNYTYKKWYYYNTAETSKTIATGVGGRDYKVVVCATFTNDKGTVIRSDYSYPTIKEITTK